jgi:hypothetical protein
MRTCLVVLVHALMAVPAGALAQAAEPPVLPVVQLGVDVLPYYSAGARFGVPPKVAVDPAWDALLSSSNPDDVRQAALGIATAPDLVKPETLIVLAMRLYDIGMRDDAVFWYYAGRFRFLTMASVLDMRSLQLVKSAEVVERFLGAAGPAMDGYAYCSISLQAEREDRAIAWVAAHPYKLLGYTELPAISADRNAALVAAVNQLRDAARKKKALLADPDTLAQLEQARARNHAHERYCW